MLSSATGVVYISINSGSTWNILIYTNNNQLWWNLVNHGKVVCDNTGQYFYARTDNSLYISSDGGNKWNQITTWKNTTQSNIYNPSINDLYTNRGSCYCNSTGEHVIVTGWYKKNQYQNPVAIYSHDYGNTWYATLCPNGSNINQAWLSEDGSIVYIGGCLSTYSGKTFNYLTKLWENISLQNQSFSSSAYGEIMIGFADGNNLMYSIDKGNTWTLEGGYPNYHVVYNIISGNGTYHYLGLNQYGTVSYLNLK